MTTWLLPALMNHLWQSTLVALLVWLATLALRGNGARVRCWLWTASSIKFLLPLSMLVSLGGNIQWRDASPVVQPAISFVLEDVLMPAAVISAVPVSAPQSTSVLLWVFAGVWAIGTAFVLTVWWRQWRPIRSALRNSTPMQLDARYAADDLAV